MHLSLALILFAQSTVTLPYVPPHQSFSTFHLGAINHTVSFEPRLPLAPDEVVWIRLAPGLVGSVRIEGIAGQTWEPVRLLRHRERSYEERLQSEFERYVAPGKFRTHTIEMNERWGECGLILDLGYRAYRLRVFTYTKGGTVATIEQIPYRAARCS